MSAIAFIEPSIFGLAFLCCFALIGLAITGFWIWMLIDAVTRCPGENNLKLIWVLVIIFTHVLGAIIYYFVQRPKNPPPNSSPTTNFPPPPTPLS